MNEAPTMTSTSFVQLYGSCSGCRAHGSRPLEDPMPQVHLISHPIGRMIYFAILTDKASGELTASTRPIEERISRFCEDYPDREHTFVEPRVEPPPTYVAQSRNRPGLTPEIERRLEYCKSVLYFEGPGNPQECADQVSVLTLLWKKSAMSPTQKKADHFNCLWRRVA